MRALPIGAALAALSLGVAVAQTTPPNRGTATTTTQGTTTQGTTTPGTTTPGTTTPAAPMQPGTAASGAGATAPANTGAMNNGAATPGTTTGGNGTAAASGNDNQAVATTNANAPQPAKGHNSFTRGQAQTRIRRHGFQKVSGLKLDGNGVWRGTAQKSGQPVSVWLDYKGNVGSGQQ